MSGLTLCQAMLYGTAAIVFVGCATPTSWSRQGGGTYDQYLKDRYACVRESPTSNTAVGVGNAYSAVAVNQTTPSCSYVIACMQARGYRQDPKGEFRPPEGGEINCR